MREKRLNENYNQADMERRPNTHHNLRPASRFSSQEKLILAVLTVMCGILLLLAVALVITTAPSPKSSAQGAIPTAAVQAQPPAQPAQNTPRPAPSLPACAASLAGEWVENARVINGGTLEVLRDGVPALIGYAAVRVSEEMGLNAQAADAARALVEGQPVYLASSAAEIDSAGRSMRYVFAGGRFVNLELVETGLAKADVYSEEKACINLLQQGEQQARADHTGVWQATEAPTATFMPMVTLDPAFQPPCDCSARPECSSFTRRADAQACYNACNDYNSRLDSDRDGLACEGLP